MLLSFEDDRSFFTKLRFYFVHFFFLCLCFFSLSLLHSRLDTTGKGKNHRNNNKMISARKLCRLTSEWTWNWLRRFRWLFYSFITLYDCEMYKKIFASFLCGIKEKIWTALQHATAMNRTFTACFQLTNERFATWKSSDALYFLRSDGKLCCEWRHCFERKNEEKTQRVEPESFIYSRILKALLDFDCNWKSIRSKWKFIILKCNFDLQLHKFMH